jgi:hypothetical protein
MIERAKSARAPAAASFMLFASRLIIEYFPKYDVLVQD